MKRVTVGLASFLFAALTWASTPTPLSTNLPPLRTPAAPHLPPPTRVGPVLDRWTPEIIRGLGLSGSVTQDLLAHLFPAQAPIDPGTNTAPASERSVGPAVDARHRLSVGTTATVQGTVQADSDANQDYEGAIIANRYTENGQTVDRVTSVYTKVINDVPSHWWTSATTNNFVSQSFSGWPTGNQLAIPAPATRSSDPMLSENPYSACNGCPIANPKRTYAVGVSYNLNGPNGGYGDTLLTVWYTDHVGDPNYPWTPLVVNQGFNPLFFDKPSIWTSWDQAHGTLGYTYIAVILDHLTSPTTSNHDIQIYRQTTGTHFDLVHTFQYLPQNATSPIITVDSATGDVYVLWLDSASGTISIARSTDMGNTFGTPIAFTAQSLVPDNGCSNIIANDPGRNVRVQAVSSIMARPNAADNSIGVVWHLFESDNLHTDIGFNRFQLATQSWTNYRGRPLGHVTADLHDQWNPAVDVATDGTYMTGWYDKRNDVVNNETYQVFACRVGADGTPIDGNDTMVYGATPADPTQLKAYVEPQTCGFNLTRRFMGEYQDLWEWYGTWYGATSYIANNQQDMYITRLTPSRLEQ